MFRSPRRLLLGLVVLPWTAALAGAQNLTMGVGSPVSSLDPHYHLLRSNNEVGQMLFDTLLTTDARAQLQPGLAENLHGQRVNARSGVRSGALGLVPSATFAIQDRLGHLAPRRVPGTHKQHPKAHCVSSSLFCIATADAGQAQVNSTEHCTRSGTSSRPTQAKPNRGK